MVSQHTAEFRQEAVRVALTSGLNRKQVASDFGVGFSTLSRWIQLERRGLSEPTAQSDLEAEVTKGRFQTTGNLKSKRNAPRAARQVPRDRGNS